MNFNQYLSIIEFTERSGSAVMPSWAKDIASKVPNIELDIPMVRRTSKIVTLLDKKNPIYVQLADGTKLFFSNDEFRRINGKPAEGKEMTVLFQRPDADKSNNPSKIVKCIVQ